MLYKPSHRIIRLQGIFNVHRPQFALEYPLQRATAGTIVHRCTALEWFQRSIRRMVTPQRVYEELRPVSPVFF